MVLVYDRPATVDLAKSHRKTKFEAFTPSIIDGSTVPYGGCEGYVAAGGDVDVREVERRRTIGACGQRGYSVSGATPSVSS